MSQKPDASRQPETTGHVWDGIEEYNNPLPRWWLWTFYATIVWGVIYCILYPAWPLVDRATAGVLGWSARGEVAAEIDAVAARQAELRAALVETDLAALPDDRDLHRFAVQAGASLFRNNCSQCHGSGAAGAEGYPNLLDDAWLWGGSREEIAYSIRHGIRNDEDDAARFSQMPGFGDMLEREEVVTLAAHVRAMPEGTDPLAGEGGELFATYCTACHGQDGTGNRDLGAPDLTDAIWLYGSDADSVATLIAEGPFGVMPPWGERLGEPSVRALAAYVHQLGGGEEPEAQTAGAGDPEATPVPVRAEPSDVQGPQQAEPAAN
ncbi:cytochrome-c oxidase, cbb3-type subunit III [Roseivivax sp. CAU 1761]